MTQSNERAAALGRSLRKTFMLADRDSDRQFEALLRELSRPTNRKPQRDPTAT